MTIYHSEGEISSKENSIKTNDELYDLDGENIK